MLILTNELFRELKRKGKELYTYPVGTLLIDADKVADAGSVIHSVYSQIVRRIVFDVHEWGTVYADIVMFAEGDQPSVLHIHLFSDPTEDPVLADLAGAGMRIFFEALRYLFGTAIKPWEDDE